MDADGVSMHGGTSMRQSVGSDATSAGPKYDITHLLKNYGPGMKSLDTHAHAESCNYFFLPFSAYDHNT
jgi:hypothetical protein